MVPVLYIRREDVAWKPAAAPCVKMMGDDDDDAAGLMWHCTRACGLSVSEPQSSTSARTCSVRLWGGTALTFSQSQVAPRSVCTLNGRGGTRHPQPSLTAPLPAGFRKGARVFTQPIGKAQSVLRSPDPGPPTTLRSNVQTDFKLTLICLCSVRVACSTPL